MTSHHTRFGLEQDPVRGQLDVGITGALRELRILLRALRKSRFFRPCAMLALGIVLVIGLNMFGQVRLNAWQGDFYNALEQRHLEAMLDQSLVFFAIVAVLLTMVVGETWLREILEVRMREWLTRDLLDQWVLRKRPYLLALAGEMGVNPDQRMQADAQHLTELTIALSIGLLRSTLLLLSFLGVLWVLSGEIVFTLWNEAISIPGYLVWCALAYAISGSWLTWKVGRPLIAINGERYAREADLRFALVRISENAEAIAVYGGETHERRGLDLPVDEVVAITRRLANALARLTWVTSGYGWLALIVPLLAASPGYFQGSMSFGGLMMTVGAFNQVQAALQWFVTNFPSIADWRATLLRVATFREALPGLDAQTDGSHRIEYVEQPSGTIIFENLAVSLLDGQVALEEPLVELEPGERLLILGRRGVGKSTVFRAMAGLWPWGSGTIRLPRRESIMFMPQRPYLPLATLRAAVTYPKPAQQLPNEAVHAALLRVGLAHLIPALDQDQRWDKSLSLEEQQRLTLARLLLHRPDVVFLDEALSAFDLELRQLMLSIFDREMAGTTVVSIGSGQTNESFYNRCIHLRRLPGAAGIERRERSPEPVRDIVRLEARAVLAGRASIRTKPDPDDAVRIGRL